LQLHVKYYFQRKLHRLLNHRYIIPKKTFTAAFRYYCPWNHIINKLSLETSHHETNLKHENFTVSPDIIYSYTSVAMVQNHFTTSTSWCLQNLRTVGMVD